jgi:hypothetical protein
MEHRPSGIPSTVHLFRASRKRSNLITHREAFVPRIALAIIFAATLCGTSWAQSNSSPNCQLIASLPPMATFGGPATGAPGQTELGLAFGGYGELMPSPCIHAGGEDWFVRLRRGVSNRLDLGFDTLLDNQTDGSLGITAKAALRYQVTRGLRLEAGVGASDQGDGKAVNADLAAVIGTNHPDKIWNYYMSLRLGASRGLCDSSPCTATAGNHLPGALVPLGVIGTTARVSDNVHFVMETGLGGVFSREHPGTATYLHLSFGVLFNVGKGRK